MSDEKQKSKRGFGSMSPERLREVSSLGGSSVPSDKRTFAKDPSAAADAGRAGGRAKAKRRLEAKK